MGLEPDQPAGRLANPFPELAGIDRIDAVRHLDPAATERAMR